MIYSEEQQKAIDAAASGKNVFITGGGGVGKSEIVKEIIRLFEKDGKNVQVAAFTGIAAVPLGGITLHALFATSIELKSVPAMYKKIKQSARDMARWNKMDVLVIDEISMVDPVFFVKMAMVGRLLKDFNKPFGLQVIFVGDFTQLPPIMEKSYRIDTYDSKKVEYCFETKTWEELDLTTINLVQSFRHTDKNWIDILSRMRFNELTLEDKIQLRTRLQYKTQFLPHIYPYNVAVDTKNEEEISKIIKEERCFTCRTSSVLVETDEDGNEAEKKIALEKNVQYLLRNCMAPNSLKLKVGAEVLLLCNLDFNRNLVNGSRGIVVAFDEESKNPVVEFSNNEIATIGMHVWTMDDKTCGKASYHQIPLKLSYAFSVHKSQGQTLECATISMKKIFENGQAYVAFSRVRSLEKIALLDFDESLIKVHPKVVYFYKNGYKPYQYLDVDVSVPVKETKKFTPSKESKKFVPVKKIKKF